MTPSAPAPSSGFDPAAYDRPPPCAPVTRGVVLAQLEHAVRVMARDPAAADQHVVETLELAGWTWAQLLDLRPGLRGDALDALLADTGSDVPPLGWRHSLIGLPRAPHWTFGRIVLVCAAHMRPALLAEAAVLANLGNSGAADLGRLELLARMAWRARRRAVQTMPELASA